MKITIQDVAKDAGVSITTVSRVINNNYPVKLDTRKKVEESIKKLNFKPNALARGLISNKTETIGVIIPSITNLFFPAVVKGIEKILKREGYTIYLCDTDSDEEEEVRFIRSLSAKQVDGIIVIDPSTKNIKSGLYEDLSKRMPLVCINGYNDGVRCNFVLNDEKIGTIEGLEYLLELNHKDITFVRGHDSYSYDIKERIYKELMERKNLADNSKIVDIGKGNVDETMDLTMNKITRILESGEAPTAFFCCNDLMALGVINACKKNGTRVPEDISVIGFDNIMVSSLVEPKITTIDQNMDTLGKKAAELLLKNINNKNSRTEKIILNTELVIRNSCSEASKES